MGAEEEDLETPLQPGNSLPEMGLLEEAISEFQKVAKATTADRAFPLCHAMLHAPRLAFMEKAAGIAAIMVRTRLKTPAMIRKHARLAV